MAKLEVPTEDAKADLDPMAVTGYGSISHLVSSGADIGKTEQTQGAAAISSAAEMGKQEQDLGGYVGQAGLAQASQGLKDMTNSIYNIVQSNAATAYNTAAAAHVANSIKPAKDGATNYGRAQQFAQSGALAGDLDQISKQVQAKYITGLQDPASKQKFTDSMSTLNQNHKILADSVQRNAQAGVSQSALSQALDSDIQSGLIDSPDNIGFYAHQGISRISDALEAGSISTQQAAALGDNLRKNLYFGSLSVQNQKDPNAVGQLLQNSKPEDLNLNQLEYDTLVKQNQFAKHDADVLNKTQYQAQNEINAAKSSYEFGSLQDGLKAGTVNSTQVMDAYDKGKISFTQMSQLADVHQTEVKKADDTWHVRSSISSDMDTGRVLSDYTPQQIDDHYVNRVKSVSGDGTTNLDLMQKADIAAQYKGPVNNISREIQYDIESGDPAKLKDGVAAFNKLQETNPLVLSGIKDDKFMAYASALTDAYKYTTSMDQTGIQKIHDSIYNVDGRTQTSRNNRFSKESAFSLDSIKSTIANMYSGGNPWYRGKDDVSDDTVAMLQPLFRQAYQQTGDKDSAIEMVKNQTKALIGHSAVNYNPSWLPDGGSIMALPPEQVYGNKANAQQIRQLVNQEIAPILPKGVSPDQVMLGSDDKTLAEARYRDPNGQPIPPSYYLHYKDDNGQDVLLPKRWSLDSTSDALLQNIKGDAANKGQNVPATNTPIPAMSMTNNDYKSALAGALQSTKGFGDLDKPILNEDFINKASSAQYIPQILSHYPGDPAQKPVVAAALNSMIGADKDSWRVSQSMKLVNSVLTNNAAPSTYLRYGMVTSQPKVGDMVVSSTRAGLYGGIQNVNGEPMIKMISMINGGLQVSVVDQKDVKGFRSLPTPENFSQQADSLSTKPAMPRFNIYGNGGQARTPNGQERINPYDMTSSIEPTDKVTKPTVYDVNSGNLVNQDQSFTGQLKAAINKSAPSSGSNVPVSAPTQARASVTSNVTNANGSKNSVPIQPPTAYSQSLAKAQAPVEVPNSQPSSPQTTTTTTQYANAGDQSPGGYIGADQGIAGQQVELPNGSMDEAVGYENGKIRTKSGKLVSKEDVKLSKRKK